MKLITTIILFISTSVYASCPQFYPPRETIKIPGTTELCNSFYVTLYDETNKAVILTSELLSVGKNVGGMSRTESFRADPRVNDSPDERSYSRSGYDRGHMVASDNASSLEEMSDTYLMTNMTPQHPDLNRKNWAKLEQKIRQDFFDTAVDTWVVTIAVYSRHPEKIKSGIPIPSSYWKLVYRGIKVDVYHSPNDKRGVIYKMTNINPSQLLSNIEKNASLAQ